MRGSLDVRKTLEWRRKESKAYHIQSSGARNWYLLLGSFSRPRELLPVRLEVTNTKLLVGKAQTLFLSTCHLICCIEKTMIATHHMTLEPVQSCANSGTPFEQKSKCPNISVANCLHSLQSVKSYQSQPKAL